MRYDACARATMGVSMRKVKVISKKFDDSLRNEYETSLYIETEETITLFSEPGLRYFDHRKAAWFAAPDGLLEIFLKHKWYNVLHIVEQVSQLNLIYVNIALPPKLQENVLEWTDLDIDYRMHLDHSVERLDQLEYDQNVLRLGYPPDVIEGVRAACQEVEVGFTSALFPFDHERQVALYRRIKKGG